MNFMQHPTKFYQYLNYKKIKYKTETERGVRINRVIQPNWMKWDEYEGRGRGERFTLLVGKGVGKREIEMKWNHSRNKERYV